MWEIMDFNKERTPKRKILQPMERTGIQEVMVKNEINKYAAKCTKINIVVKMKRKS